MVKPFKIGVHPIGSLKRYERLFGALCRVFPVHFEETDSGAFANYQAMISLSADAMIRQLALNARIPCYLVLCPSESHTRSIQIKFGDDPALDARLRSRALADRRACEAPILAVTPGESVLASSDGDPIWVRHGSMAAPVDVVSVPPEELDDAEVLRDHLIAGRFIGLLPLIHFLRERTANLAWKPPPLRACFIIDDPNLHRISYGHLNYARLIDHAERHHYHTSIATIPLDSWFVNHQAANLFRDHASRVSLLVHGNNHIYQELNRPYTETQYLAMLAQAWRRIDRFEQKSALSVARVMVPPHEVYNETAISAMHRIGFDAACIRSSSCRSHLRPEHALAGWYPALQAIGGFPIIVRNRFEHDYDNFPLLAYLDQPILLDGHHGDTVNDLSLLAECAAQINSLGAVHWQGVGDISQSNYMTRQEGETLFVQLYARRVLLNLPEDISNIVVEVPSATPGRADEQVFIDNVQTPLCSDVMALRTGPISTDKQGVVEIRLRHSRAVSPYDITAPSPRLWPVIRRLITESRDRIQPIFGNN